MTPRTCAHCHGPMDASLSVRAKYCGASCRVMASRARKAAPRSTELPAALTRIPRWVRHSAAKVPLTPSGAPASSVDPATWSGHDDAASSTVGAGMGFVLAGDGITCVDLDHCLSDDGSLSAEAEAFLATLPPTYIEISPSGDGLHVWGTGMYITCRKLRGSLQGEVIASKKYATVTGRRFRNAPLTLANIAKPAGALLAG